ncbi:MAG: ADP-ribosylglycohydrolase family protein [Desulfitobacteriaceae bacterium]|nr:ADP-ribosylglycohydrolase family protein [Desulfitobacteriaceae bacterium]MDI6915092.1 ADP-ribosylglycohydrolase family protein [Desulfitobacteriaceae bacterium]
MKLSLAERMRGGLFGVLVGDALGIPIQFKSRETIRKHPVTGMQGYGTFNLPPGAWSDDSSLTLCLLESLSEKGYDLRDIGERFLKWYKEGYLTPFGKSFDIGWTTEQAMERLSRGVPVLEAGMRDERSNGNGSLMRILPAVYYFAQESDDMLVSKVTEISCMTHAHRRSQLACSIYALMVRALLEGAKPRKAYQMMRVKANSLFEAEATGELRFFSRILSGMLPGLREHEVRSSGYVVDTLEASLWCLLHSQSFAEMVLLAVNMGDDTDTVGAVTGGLAGTCYGDSGISRDWEQALVKYDEINALVARFVAKVAFE